MGQRANIVFLVFAIQKIKEFSKKMSVLLLKSTVRRLQHSEMIMTNVFIEVTLHSKGRHELEFRVSCHDSFFPYSDKGIQAP